jgi:2-polyprenyl-3-methyl-5-hydroxy-6-metoxy-1,4-benzoquinol methylase/Tfp pilus assembly protein PilF
MPDVVTKQPARASAKATDDRFAMAVREHRAGRLAAAETLYRGVLVHSPRHVGALQNLGLLGMQTNRPAVAVEAYGAALALKPDVVEAHHNLAAALVAQGKLDQALVHFQRALALNPNLAETHLNIGNVLLAQGRSAEAAPHYQRGLAIRADFPKAQHSLGVALAMQGKLAEALPRFERALALQGAANDLARTLYNLGRTDEALGLLAQAIGRNGTAETKGLFVQFLRDHRAPARLDNLPGLLVRALTEPWARPGKVGLVAAPLVRNDAGLRPVIGRAVSAWPRRLAGPDLWGDAGLAAICEHRLLGALLTSAPVCDVALERFLTGMRFALLGIATAGDTTVVDEKLLGFCCALAQQCFLNEYVYACTEEEARGAQSLHASVSDALASGGDVPALRLAAAACYGPLHLLPEAGRLLDRAWPESIGGLLQQQVREPAEELRLRGSIPALTPIEDTVSLAVRKQYEENPFPRWVKCEPPIKQWTVDQFLRSRFPRAPSRSLGKADVHILIAGCGTGQQAIEIAQRHPQARLLAVDLSLSSLAYASRQTRALGLERIEYAQADILKLAGLGRTFDLIVSSGVLHHLAEPFAGWQTLLALLRPGGVMSVGLYSELARAHIRAARSFIAARGYAPTAADIRRCRQDLMDLPAVAPERKAVRTKDFFSTSECRDLLFHVQEHRLTLPQIAAFLADNDLAVLGFDVGERERARYRKRFPDDPAMTDLGCWHTFESENLDTFIGMYQFWVQSGHSQRPQG